MFRRPKIITALDIGSSKISCITAKITPLISNSKQTIIRHQVDVLGYGAYRSCGVRAGVITCLDSCSVAVRKAIQKTEKISGHTVEKVFTGINTYTTSDHISVTLDIKGRNICKPDISRLITAGINSISKQGRCVIHAIPENYCIDESCEITEPEGMYANKLSANIHLVSADQVQLNNLELCLEQNGIEISGLTLSSYASGIACIDSSEATMGSVVIDIGGGTTKASSFEGNKLLDSLVLPIGGSDLTLEIARNLSIDFQDAEYLKTKFSSTMHFDIYDTEMLQFLPNDYPNSDNITIPRAKLTKIISKWTENILEQISEELSYAGLITRHNKKLIFTGGGSKILNLLPLARRILGENVRCGRPLGVKSNGMPVKDTESSCVVGLLVHSQLPEVVRQNKIKRKIDAENQSGYMSLVGSWLKDNF